MATASALALAASPAFATPVPDAPASAATSVYFIGNSLSQDLVGETLDAYNQEIPTVDGLEALLGEGTSVGWDIRFGQPLSVAAAEPDRPGAGFFGTSTTPFPGAFAQQQLATGSWENVVLQPYASPVTEFDSTDPTATYGEELAAFESLARLAQDGREDVQLYLYATWSDTGLLTPGGSENTAAEVSAEALARWDRPFVDTDTTFYSSASVYEQLASDLAADGFDVNVINVGEVFASLIEADNGIEAEDLMRDNIHATRLGRYAAAVTTTAVITGDSASLLGLPEFYTSDALVDGFTVDGLTSDPVSEADAVLVRNAVATVVPEPTTAAVALMAAPVLMLRRRRAAA